MQRHLCAILILAALKVQLDSHLSFLVFTVMHVERIVLNIRRCLSFRAYPPRPGPISQDNLPATLSSSTIFLTETTMSDVTSTFAFSDSTRLDFECFLRCPNQNNPERLTNSTTILIMVYMHQYILLSGY